MQLHSPTAYLSIGKSCLDVLGQHSTDINICVVWQDLQVGSNEDCRHQGRGSKEAGAGASWQTNKWCLVQGDGH